MTTIKSGHIDTIEVDVKLGRPHQQMPREGEVWLDVILAHNGETVYANVPTAELLAALDAVPREAETQLIAEREELKDFVKAVEAERGELAATIERLKAWAVDYFGALHISEGFDAALTPPKPFELPTEAGARFEARFNDGDPEVFTAWTDGTEVLYKGYAGWNDAERFANGGWHDFRLLDGAA